MSSTVDTSMVSPTWWFNERALFGITAMATRGLRSVAVQLCRAAALSRRQIPALASTYRRINSEAETVSVESGKGTNSSIQYVCHFQWLQ